MSYFTFFVLNQKNLVCILYLEHISILSSLLSRAQKPHVANGPCLGQLCARSLGPILVLGPAPFSQGENEDPQLLL